MTREEEYEQKGEERIKLKILTRINYNFLVVSE